MTTPKIHIHFENELGSFRAGSEFNMEGNLILISGINGSGKSQLLKKIASGNGIEVNDEQISGRIIYKSLRDALEISPIKSEAPTDFETLKSYILGVNKNALLWEHKPGMGSYHHPKPKITLEQILYNTLSSEYSDIGNGKYPEIQGYSQARKEIIKEIRLIENGPNMPEDELLKRLESIDIGKVWHPDNVDYFSTVGISKLFYEYVERRGKYMQENNGKKSKIEYEKKYKTPWGSLNQILGELGISYKFADDYEIGAGKITGGVSLLDTKGKPISYEITELSDGEKAILSLAIAALRAGYTGYRIGLLLLDEYDAILNPSLTKTFYNILEKYFITNGTVVIIATHSTATLAMCPTEKEKEMMKQKYTTKKYELERDSNGGHKLCDVSEHYYDELKLAHESVYGNEREKINRIKTYLLDNKNILFVEGSSDKTIFDNAKEKLEISLAVEIIDIGGTQNAIKYQNYVKKYSNNSKSFIFFIFDFDQEGYIGRKRLDHKDAKNVGYPTLQKDNAYNIYSLFLPIPTHRKNYAGTDQEVSFLTIEHLFGDNIIYSLLEPIKIIENVSLLLAKKAKESTENQKKKKEGAKKKFAKNTVNFKKEDFTEFIEIFTLLEKITKT